MELIEILNNITNIQLLIIFIISAAPIGELRFSIPYGLLLTDLSWSSVIIVSIIGNISSGIAILYILPYFVKIITKNSLINRYYTHITRRTYTRSYIIQQRKYYGLIFFVSLPFPFTGVWTGALASNLLGLSKHKSTLAIIIGVFLSSITVTSFVMLGILALSIF